MGLLHACYTFGGPLPAMDQIIEVVGELAVDPVVVRGTLEASAEELQEAQLPARRSGSVRLRHNQVCFRFREQLERRRGQLRVEVAASLEGTELHVTGNDDRLFRAVCAALGRCGGVETGERFDAARA